MGKRLFVGNLPYDADEDLIREAFAAGGGTVERVHIPLDRDTQRPRGFAFVDMASEAEAFAALQAMNGASMGTRTLSVSEAEDGRSSRPRDGARDDRNRGDRPREGRPREDQPRNDRPSSSRPSSSRPSGDRPSGSRAGDDPPRDERDSSESARATRPHRFGPDSKPVRERGREGDRERERRGGKRSHGDDDSEFHGRRGHQRFGDDDDDD